MTVTHCIVLYMCDLIMKLSHFLIQYSFILRYVCTVSSQCFYTIQLVYRLNITFSIYMDLQK